MTDPVARFYDELADSYHLNFRDWHSSVVVQGEFFSQLIASRLDQGQQSILDCCCGIGTQALGLALRGHRVTGSDLSTAAVRRARAEARNRGVRLPITTADMRRLPFADAAFDVVVCADNALPHLLDEQQLSTAMREMHRVLRPGGLLVATIRDYRHARRTRSTTTAPLRTQDGRAMSFQLWDWHDDGQRYDLRHVQLSSNEVADWRVVIRRTTYWAITPDELSTIIRSSGFGELEWREPIAGGFYQPVLLATRSTAEK